MSTSIKLIKFSGIVSIILLVLTYIITVNMEAHFIEYNTIWFSNNFLLTIVGGAYTSMLVVLLCEIHKYFITKSEVEAKLFYQAMYLYLALFLMQQNILDFQNNPNEAISENLLDSNTNKVSAQLYCLKGIEYETLLKNNSIMKAHRKFCNETFSHFFPIEDGVNSLRRAIIEEKIKKIEKGDKSIVTSSDEKVMIFLSKHYVSISFTLEEVNRYLETIDNSCRNKYNWKDNKKLIHSAYINLFSTLNT